MATDNGFGVIKSAAWGGTEQSVTQPFGVYGMIDNPEQNYAYSAELGYPVGYHVGIDVDMPKGTKIFALNPGEVIQAGMNRYFRPKPVWVETKDDPETRGDESGRIEIYGHLWDNSVRSGDTVKTGSPLGISGEQTTVDNAGNPTMTPDGSGPHLHYELRQKCGAKATSGWCAVDPVPWLVRRGAIAPNDPDNPEEPKPGPNPAPGGNPIEDAVQGIVIERIKTWLSESASRIFFVVLGLIIVAIGLSSALKPGGGVRALANKVPAVRLATFAFGKK